MGKKDRQRHKVKKFVEKKKIVVDRSPSPLNELVAMEGTSSDGKLSVGNPEQCASQEVTVTGSSTGSGDKTSGRDMETSCSKDGTENALTEGVSNSDYTSDRLLRKDSVPMDKDESVDHSRFVLERGGTDATTDVASAQDSAKLAAVPSLRHETGTIRSVGSSSEANQQRHKKNKKGADTVDLPVKRITSNFQMTPALCESTPILDSASEAPERPNSDEFDGYAFSAESNRTSLRANYGSIHEFLPESPTHPLSPVQSSTVRTVERSNLRQSIGSTIFSGMSFITGLDLMMIWSRSALISSDYNKFLSYFLFPALYLFPIATSHFLRSRISLSIRSNMLMSQLLSIVGFLITALGRHFSVILLGRFFIGLGVSSHLITAPSTIESMRLPLPNFIFLQSFALGLLCGSLIPVNWQWAQGIFACVYILMFLTTVVAVPRGSHRRRNSVHDVRDHEDYVWSVAFRLLNIMGISIMLNAVLVYANAMYDNVGHWTIFVFISGLVVGTDLSKRYGSFIEKWIISIISNALTFLLFVCYYKDIVGNAALFLLAFVWTVCFTTHYILQQRKDLQRSMWRNNYWKEVTAAGVAITGASILFNVALRKSLWTALEQLVSEEHPQEQLQQILHRALESSHWIQHSAPEFAQETIYASFRHNFTTLFLAAITLLTTSLFCMTSNSAENV
ncbi:Vba4p KNAG_0H03180 [Huiozyma naganishii CBS 8797]|uniref:Uncharacterized protein n=1 Tax=Huiozyma naganishii (strain ATCC MYA-139 / BCRC 22969 / CBS 8797 / KCTC 17520 / NBRC 10181 / NCYC 3082 / Yp74L-3) TaxID=1071383 RepID=J7RPR7_HUIN7|nr:hypothetical protein KNAG_0H03180 [Kazachstania naganishii CBS 8797]CCK71733.1 hypothetical protein KNAG_0H03180 [Kazachstania naganishii CBS 8797]